ncbi:uncharacterized protein PG986_008802 [Apiospora aurea]|uniref:Uncharacterized protein n=1 Tax=Apiospora aurea TaxID=335848 RepID=A0ABR1Q5S2_9PEZI
MTAMPFSENTSNYIQGVSFILTKPQHNRTPKPVAPTALCVNHGVGTSIYYTDPDEFVRRIRAGVEGATAIKAPAGRWEADRGR